jgi:alpha-tubulin suppressor-like RCC1 family protein
MNKPSARLISIACAALLLQGVAATVSAAQTGHMPIEYFDVTYGGDVVGELKVKTAKKTPSYVLVAEGLTPDTKYAFIYYNEATDDFYLLGTKDTNQSGRLRMDGTFSSSHLDDLPSAQFWVTETGPGGGSYNSIEPGRNFIAAGDHHSLAVTCDGRVYAWGGNWNGQLGINSDNSHQVPYQVHGVDNNGYLTDIVDVGAGIYRSLALKSDGTVYAWGDNSDRELGAGNTLFDLPLKVPGQVYADWQLSYYLTGVKSIDDGGAHSLALSSDGAIVWAWGDDNHCQLAHWDECGSTNYYPTQVKGLPAGSSAVEVVGGGYHSLALMSDGSVFSWGEGSKGQLGVHSDNDHNRAVQVHGPDNAGYLTGITQVAAGLRHSLAIKEDGSLWAWGAGWYGQLGIHSDNDHTIPYQVHGVGNVGYLTDVVDVAAGNHHTLALRSDGTVYAWGANGHGQLGIHSNNDHTVPYQVHGPGNVGYLTDIIQVAAGANFSLALRSDGTVWAWGENYYGQLGINSDNDHTIPYQVHGPGNLGYLTGVGPTCSTPPPGRAAGSTMAEATTVAICHQPATLAETTLYLAASALKDHLDHGDTLGACSP